jgi:hypothetical protein
MPRASKTDWVVTLQPGTATAEAASRLRAAGLQVQDVLEAIGVVTGRATAAAAAKLRAMPGVADVSPTPSADVGPPDAPVS